MRVITSFPSSYLREGNVDKVLKNEDASITSKGGREVMYISTNQFKLNFQRG